MLFDEREELIEGGPLDVDAIPRGLAGLRFTRRTVQRRNRCSAVPSDLRGNTLRDFSKSARFGEPKLVGVGMNVDEARGQCAARARHDLPGVTLRQITDQCDATIDHGEIGNEWTAARTIVDPGG